MAEDLQGQRDGTALNFQNLVRGIGNRTEDHPTGDGTFPVVGGDVALATLRALVALANKFVINRIQRTNFELEVRSGGPELEIESSLHNLKVRAALIKSPNVIPTTIEPPIRVGTGIPVKTHPPIWIGGVYDKLEEQFPSGGAARREFEGSFISGSDDGILKSLALMVNPRMTVAETSRRVSTALIRLIARTGYDTSMCVEPEEMTVANLVRVELPLEKKAGVYTGKHWKSEDGSVIVGSQSFTKEQVQFTTALNLRCRWENLDAKLDRLGKFDSAQVSGLLSEFEDLVEDGSSLNPDEIQTFFYKLATKLEYRSPEDRPKPGEVEKFRTFMIPPAAKVMLDKWLSSSFYNFLKGKYTNGIGLNWHGGGAKQFAEHLHAPGCSCRKKHRFWHYDCSKYDHSLKAAVLMIAAMLALMAFKYSRDRRLLKLYVLSMLLLASSASNSTAHICSWLGEWRMILGQLFSGEFNTANWNTLYHMLMWECYVLFEAAGADSDTPAPTFPATTDADPAPGERKWKYHLDSLASDECVCAKFQGDDGVASVPYDSPLSLNRQRYYFKKYWDVTIKIGPPTEENDFFYSNVDPIRGSLIREGIVFLQRRIFRASIGGIVHTLPFRPIKDYWGRLGRGVGIPISTGSADDELYVMAYYRSRWVGLLFDTMETNYAAADFLRAALAELDRLDPRVQNLVAQELENGDAADPRFIKIRRYVEDYGLKLGPEFLGYQWVVPPVSGSILPLFLEDRIILAKREVELSTRVIECQTTASQKRK